MARRIAAVVGLLALLAALGLLAQRVLLEDDPTAAAPGAMSSAAPSAFAAHTGAAARRVVITEMQGRVLRRRPGGAWQPIQKGDTLALDDQLRTEAGALANLDLGEQLSVAVGEETEFTVAEVSQALSRLELVDGRISSNVRGQRKHRVRVEVHRSDAVVEGDEGSFSVMRRGGGPVAVAATRGSVRLSAKQKTIEINEGEQSLVQPGQAPSDPTKIPPSLFVKLGQPPAMLADAEETTITGQTAPGAVVSVNGVRTTASADGTFEQKVALHTGRNKILVSVQDVTGRKATGATRPITVRKTRVSGTVEW